MIKQYIDNYIKEHVEACFAIKSVKLLDAVNGLVTGIKSDIDQKDQRITDLIEQTKNQIIERMVSTTPHKAIKEKLKLPTKKEKILELLERSSMNYSINSIHLIMKDVTKSQKSHTHQCLAQLKKEGKIINPKRSIYKIKGKPHWEIGDV